MTPATPLPTDDRRQLAAPHYSTRDKPQTPPTVGAFEHPVVGCCINEEWMAHIVGSTASLEWPDAWKGTPAEVQFALDQIVEIQAHMNCECGTGCIICGTNAGANFRFNLEVEFTANGLAGIAPDRPDTSFDEDTADVGDDRIQRENALCLAVLDYVNSTLDNAIQVATTAGLRVGAGAAPLVIGLGVMAGVVFVGGIALLGTVFINRANDTDIRQAIACCMLDALSGATATQANFKTALDNCNFTPLSDLEIMRFIVDETLQDNGNWFAFIRAIGAYFAYGSISPVACFCTEEGFHCNFVTDECDWEAISGPNGFEATYDVDKGWDNGPSGVINHFVNIDFDTSEDIAITSVRILLAYSGSSDIKYDVQLFDEFDVSLFSATATVDNLETNHKFDFPEETGVRRIRIQALKTGLATDFPGHIIGCTVEADIAPFPVQPL